jgi:hypothetical protein
MIERVKERIERQEEDFKRGKRLRQQQEGRD